MPTAGGAPSWSTVEDLVEQRSRTFAYLKRVQQGDTHWLSTVELGPQEQPLQKGVDATTVLRWFYLGLSIGPLLQLQSGPPFVKAVLQLLEELHYHFANRAAQNMKVIKANVRGRAHCAFTSSVSSPPKSPASSARTSMSIAVLITATRTHVRVRRTWP